MVRKAEAREAVAPRLARATAAPGMTPVHPLAAAQLRHGNRYVVRALAHRAYRPGGGPRGRVRRFEARMHESIELHGLTGAGPPARGFSLEESQAVYFGNWMRDLNQVFVPLAVRILGSDVLFALVAYMAMRKFGRTLTPEQFGYYIPAEHIDSPGGLVAELDLLPGQPTLTNPPPAQSGAPPRPPESVTLQEPVAPGARAIPGSHATLFDVDETAVAAWIRRTNVHVERRLELAARRGRNPEGMLHFGAALHAVEDLFSHSNWIEIAVSRLLAEDPTLVPQLRGSARRAFTFGPTVTTPVGRRPVLMTGSFTSTDTQISVASEVVTFLRTPLGAPRTAAEAQAEERFMYELLRASSGRLQDREFREGVRDALLSSVPEGQRGNPAVRFAVDMILQQPYHEIYRWTRLPNVPDWVKNMLGITAAQRFMRQQMSTRVLQPAGRQFEAGGIEARVSETSLIQNLRQSERVAQGQFTDAQRESMRQIGQLTGRTPQQMEEEARREGALRAATLRGTPEYVVAGPSHSQIAKDHPTSPFFGLAFVLAATAVRLLGERMLAAWDARAGGAAPEFAFPPRPADPAEAALYDVHRREREEARTRGREVVAEGRYAAEVAPGAYDLPATRRRSADEIRAAARALRAVARAPGSTAAALAELSRALGGIDDEGSRELLARIRSRLDQASRASAGTATTIDAAALETTAARLEEAAGAIEAASTHGQRESANANLVRQRAGALDQLTRAPSLDSTYRATVLLALDRQIAATAVSFTSEQRAVAEGRQHVLPPGPLRTPTVTAIRLPDVSGQPASIRDLLLESRRLLGHPYEGGRGAWWRQTVVDFVRGHSAQIAAEIEARNAGYAVLRSPGSAGAEHAR